MQVSLHALLVLAGSIVLGEVATLVSGLLGVLGFTTTTAVVLPVAGIVAVAGLLCYGAYKTYEYLESQKA